MRRHPKSLPTCGSLRPIGEVATEIVADLRFRQLIKRLHALGPRVTGECLAHLGAKHSIQTSIEQTVEHFAELDPEALEATGANRLWPAPLYEIQPTKEPPGRPATAQSRATQPHD